MDDMIVITDCCGKDFYASDPELENTTRIICEECLTRLVIGNTMFECYAKEKNFSDQFKNVLFYGYKECVRAALKEYDVKPIWLEDKSSGVVIAEDNLLKISNQNITTNNEKQDV